MTASSRQMVRVRFAPSPTGELHVGGARTAVFNWLFARHHNGSFVVRIEDTDVERSSRESEEALLRDLHWLGLDWDEGPDVGGPFTPYRQSGRLELYHREAERLERMGKAYPCFCSDDELERKRNEARARGLPPRYDGTCRGLGVEEVEKKREAGLRETIRFSVPEGEAVVFADAVRGQVAMATSMVGDFVILRSNGLPTYNFAAVVDDAAMGITHVLRGEEHLPNTLRQILLYRALGADMPVFGHLPLILDEGRSKLSKRQGAASVAHLREEGYLPAAVVNYLALLGWSHPRGEEVLGREELVEAFTLDRVARSPATFDRGKLRWLNGKHMRRLGLEELDHLAEPFFPSSLAGIYPREKRLEILALVRDSLESLDQLPSAVGVFRPEVDIDEEAGMALKQEGARSILEALADKLKGEREDLEPERVKALIAEVGETVGFRGRELYFPIRAAVTGTVHGPDLARLIAVKGRSMVVASLEKALG